MDDSAQYVVLGVDGCRDGWVRFCVELPARKTTVEILASFADLIRKRRRPRAMAVDIPVGLVKRGARECDRQARKLLGKGRRSSVFPAPIRPLLAATSYKQAQAISRQQQGKSLSRQTYAILPKIREVDRLMTPKRQGWIREVHPEVCFWALNGKSSMGFRKSSRRGRHERLEVLRKHYANIEKHLQELRGRCKADDVLDAAAAAWTAERLASGTAAAVCVAEYDERGLRMEIVY